MRREGWLLFAGWVLAGALVVFSLLSAASIGLFVAPFAAAGIWLTSRLGRVWPEVLGMVSGAGAVCLLIALLNRDTRPCTEEGLRLSPGETEASCGGFSPTPWLVVGLVLVAAGVVAYAFMRRSAGSKGRCSLLSDAPGTSTPEHG
jgi:hypothetical protein